MVGYERGLDRIRRVVARWQRRTSVGTARSHGVRLDRGIGPGRVQPGDAAAAGGGSRQVAAEWPKKREYGLPMWWNGLQQESRITLFGGLFSTGMGILPRIRAKKHKVSLLGLGRWSRGGRDLSCTRTLHGLLPPTAPSSPRTGPVCAHAPTPSLGPSDCCARTGHWPPPPLRHFYAHADPRCSLGTRRQGPIRGAGHRCTGWRTRRRRPGG